MPPDPERERQIGYLVDMMENARTAISYVQGKDRAAFDQDQVLQDAVIWRLGIVGEAAGRTSADTRASLPDIPWRKVIAMRNILFHDYGHVSLETIWTVTQQHAPDMVVIIERHLDSLGIRRPES